MVNMMVHDKVSVLAKIDITQHPHSAVIGISVCAAVHCYCYAYLEKQPISMLSLIYHFSSSMARRFKQSRAALQG
jgi:hypothetical protein